MTFVHLKEPSLRASLPLSQRFEDDALPGGIVTVANPVKIGTGGALRFSGGGNSGFLAGNTPRIRGKAPPANNPIG